MKIGIYPGSFDPVTKGHLDVIRRSSRMVDHLIIGVLNNSAKEPLFTAEERVKMLTHVTADIPNVSVEAFCGLLVDFADQKGAQVLFRGLRAVTDFEYELQLAQTNHRVNPRVDTVFLTTSVEYAYVSSSIVKEIARYNGDVSSFVEPEVEQCLRQKLQLKE